MSSVANISRYSVVLADEVCFQGGIQFNRLIIRVSEDTRMAFSAGELQSNYLTLSGDTTMIIDPPNTLSGSDIWFKLNTAATGVIEVLRS